jgi:nucleoside-diphosphate-sugar epimerase
MNLVKVIVTGGSGFIGTNLIEFLKYAGYRSFNLDINPPLNRNHINFWHKCDILDRKAVQHAFREFKPTHVVHLAARTDLDETNSIHEYSVNTDGTKNILYAASETTSLQSIIITSSMLVCRLGHTPLSDNDYSPPNLYGKSKVLTETITRAFGLNTTWTIIRPTTIWGPWSTRHRDEFFAILQKGLYVHPGFHKILKSYGYVGNVVNQIGKILQAPRSQIHGKTFYVSDPPIDLYEWVNGFSKKLRGCDVLRLPIPFMRLLAFFGDGVGKLGFQFPLSTFRLQNMIIDNVIDHSKTTALTGTGPFTLSEGTTKTIAWLKCP